MKKVCLTFFLAVCFFIFVPNYSNAAEDEVKMFVDSEDRSGNPTSGHVVDDGTAVLEIPSNNGMQSRAWPYPFGKSVGGGTWHYGKMGYTNQAGSFYQHRSKKHSATVTYGSAYNKSVRNAGTDALAVGTYKAGFNAYYWDNAPREAIGQYSGGSAGF